MTTASPAAMTRNTRIGKYSLSRLSMPLPRRDARIAAPGSFETTTCRQQRGVTAGLGAERIVAGATGLEPATSGVTGRRSNQLSYAPATVDRGATSYLGTRGVSSNSRHPRVRCQPP